MLKKAMWFGLFYMQAQAHKLSKDGIEGETSYVCMYVCMFSCKLCETQHNTLKHIEDVLYNVFCLAAKHEVTKLHLTEERSEIVLLFTSLSTENSQCVVPLDCHHPFAVLQL